MTIKNQEDYEEICKDTNRTHTEMNFFFNKNNEKQEQPLENKSKSCI